MFRTWRRGVSGLLLLGLLAAGVLAGDTDRAGLNFQIYDAGEGHVLFSESVEVGDQVRLEHVHSVHRRPVEEIFSVSGPGVLAMEEIRFDRFGANLPSGPERIGGVTTTFLREESGIRVLHHGRPLGAVSLNVGGPGVNHVITLPDGERVRLLDLARQGARVELRVQGVLET